MVFKAHRNNSISCGGPLL